MPARKRRVRHDEIVHVFATRLRTVRLSRGMTQAELANLAVVALPYISRLESAAAAPGIDLVERLAKALGTTAADLLATDASLPTSALLRERAHKLFNAFLDSAQEDDLLMFNPLLARLIRNR